MMTEGAKKLEAHLWSGLDAQIDSADQVLVARRSERTRWSVALLATCLIALFAIQFAVARELLTYDRTVILEGNFRPGEHERPLLAVLPAACDPGVAISQVLRRVEESERLARLRRRAFDPGRHSGHRDAELALTATHGGGAFLDLPGKRVECASDASQADYEELPAIVLAANVNSRTV